MVNVGGRSKACSTCRKRRIKCDEAKPVCMRCQRHGLTCDGARDITFVAGKIVQSRRTVKSKPDSKSSKSTGTRPTNVPIPESPSLNGFQFELSLCYFRKHLRPEGPIDQALQKWQLNDIIAAGTLEPSTTSSIRFPPSTPATQRTFPPALLSVAILVFSTRHHIPSLMSCGLTIYGHTLTHLNHALSAPKSHMNNQVFLTVAALAMLECLVPTGPANYLKHMDALARLCELRGPGLKYAKEEEEEEEDKVLYKGSRHMILFSALKLRKKSVLARSEWKELFGGMCESVEEREEQVLWDVLADCSVLMSEANSDDDDGIRGVEEKRVEIWAAVMGLLRQVGDWKRRWDGRKGREISGFDVSICGMDHELVQGGSSDGFDEAEATMLILYNTALIYVFRITTSLLGDNDQQLPVEGSGKFTKDRYILMERTAALEICKYVPYFHSQRKAHPESKSSPVVHWAIVLAWETLCPASDAKDMDKDIVSLISSKGKEVAASGIWGE